MCLWKWAPSDCGSMSVMMKSVREGIESPPPWKNFSSESADSVFLCPLPLAPPCLI